MIYVLVNPFSSGTRNNSISGIDVYYQNVTKLLEDKYTCKIIENKDRLSRKLFQEKVRYIITKHYSPSEVLIEAPECRASTLLLPKGYKTHIRIHCPSAITQYYDAVDIDRELLFEEMNVIECANIVSSPSYRMRSEIEFVIRNKNIYVFGNPIGVINFGKAHKTIDVVFLNRFQQLKGIQFINPILEKLPADFKVVLIGSGASLFKLSKSIKCNVTIKEQVSGLEKDKIVSASKTTIVLSLFESYSMAIADSISNNSIGVCWDTCGASEEIGLPILHSIKFGETDLFANKLIYLCRGSNYPGLSEFEGVVKKSQNNYLSSIDKIIKDYKGLGQISNIQVASSNKGKTKENESLLSKIVQNVYEVNSVNMDNYTSRLKRKWRKFRRDPDAFFGDTKIKAIKYVGRVFFNARSQEVRDDGNISNAIPLSSTEPRDFGVVTYDREKLNFKVYGKKIAEEDASTVIFIEKNDQYLIDQPLLGDALKDKEFFGFRDRYLFAFRYDLQEQFTQVSDMKKMYDSSRDWNKRMLSGIRNIVFRDPDNILPFMFRATHHDTRLIIIVTDECRTENLIKSMSHDIDVLIIHSSAEIEDYSARRIFVYENNDEMIEALKRSIIDNKIKEKNMLIPICGKEEYISDIDILNESEIDGVIILKDRNTDQYFDNFRDMIGDFNGNIESLLLREEKYLQYKDICDRNCYAELLTVSLNDGCRYEVRS